MAEIDPDTMATPWRRDPSETAPALQRWVEHTMGAGTVVTMFATGLLVSV